MPHSTQDELPVRRNLPRKILALILAGMSFSAALGAVADWSAFLAGLSRARVADVMAPALAISASYLIDSLRYILVFRPFGVRLAFRDALYNNISGYFFGGITPSSAGGQPFQIYHFSKIGLDSAISTNIIFSRLTIIYAVQFLVALLFSGRGVALIRRAGGGTSLLFAAMAASLTISTLLTIALRNPDRLGILARRIEGSRAGRLAGRLLKDPQWARKIDAWTGQLRDGFRLLWGEKRLLMLADVLLHTAGQTVLAFGFFVPFVALTQAQVDFGEFFFIYMLGSLISGFFITPGATGGVEATFVFILGALSKNHAGTMGAIVLWRFGSYHLQLILGGLVYTIFKPQRGLYAKGEDGIVRRRFRRDPENSAPSG
jgi:uncharacterized protein (TIRG00374 family)